MKKSIVVSSIFAVMLFAASACFALSPINPSEIIPDEYMFTFSNNGIPGLNGERSVTVVISDIHLGMDDKYAEIQENRPHLVAFLKKIQNSPNVKELVIAGDFLDEWFIPAGVDTYAGESQKEFALKVAKNNRDIVDVFNAIIQEDKIKVTYVPGNHDLLIDSESMQAVFPGIFESRDVRGLGLYSPENMLETVIEHGHRYNFFCAPDPISNSEIAQGSILPPGYFFTRMATLSVVEGKPKPSKIRPDVLPNSLGTSQNLAYLYWKVWDACMKFLPIREAYDEKIIKTNIDGFKDTYALRDVVPFQLEKNGVIETVLFKNIQDTWKERQILNKVPVEIPVKDAIINSAADDDIDNQAVVQYFNNKQSDKRIVVFGHTHVVQMIPSVTHNGNQAVYVNSGTWIDHNNGLPTRTFVTITPSGSKRYVGLYSYTEKGELQELGTYTIDI